MHFAKHTKYKHTKYKHTKYKHTKYASEQICKHLFFRCQLTYFETVIAIALCVLNAIHEINCFLSSCQDVVEGNRAAHAPEDGVEIAVEPGFGKIIPKDTSQLCSRVESVESRSNYA